MGTNGNTERIATIVYIAYIAYIAYPALPVRTGSNDPEELRAVDTLSR